MVVVVTVVEIVVDSVLVAVTVLEYVNVVLASTKVIVVVSVALRIVVTSVTGGVGAVTVVVILAV